MFRSLQTWFRSPKCLALIAERGGNFRRKCGAKRHNDLPCNKSKTKRVDVADPERMEGFVLIQIRRLLPHAHATRTHKPDGEGSTLLLEKQFQRVSFTTCCSCSYLDDKLSDDLKTGKIRG